MVKPMIVLRIITSLFVLCKLKREKNTVESESPMRRQTNARNTKKEEKKEEDDGDTSASATAVAHARSCGQRY